MADMRSRIADEVHKLVSTGSAATRLARLPDDPGIVPANGAAWRVHADFAAMMVGGVAALLLQMLHPAALAGVWDHSNFRKDTLGRLRRTAQYIAATTFGGTDFATGQIDRVRRIHDRVDGTLPDGTPYSANDPAVLTFVHVAGAHNFLAAFMRYRDPGFSRADQDRYFAETAVVAQHLGATEVPQTARGVEAYLRAIRPQLRADARSRDVAAALLAQPAGVGAAAPVNRILIEAGIDLLPDWAADMHGLRIPAYRKPFIRAGTLGTSAVLRWALTGDAERRANARPQPDTRR